MISQGERQSGDELLLDQVIAEFLQAEAAGRAGDRQVWLDRYPACAAGLIEFFDDRASADRLMRPVRLDRQADAQLGPATDVFVTQTPATGAKSTEGNATDVFVTQTPGAGNQRLSFVSDPSCLLAARYRPLRFHARGGMGEIWLAKDERIGRRVAVKTLRPGRDPNHARFLVEAQITGQLEHPSIVPLHDLGFDEAGQPFYVMKFVHGRRLKDAIAEFHAQKPSTDWSEDLEFRRLLESLVSVCNVVAYAHHKGVLHRDIKPDNVMLGPYGETVVLDWGLAKVIGQPEAAIHSAVRLGGSGSTATQDGAILGSPYYMSPEGAQGRPEAIDQSSDVYLLGATLYEMLTARPPRQGSTSWELINLALNSRPADPRKGDPRIPRSLEAICLKAMAFDKLDRYETPLALAEDLERFLAGAPTVAYREPWLARAGRWVRRHRRSIQYALTALCVIAAAVFAVDNYRKASLLAEREQARSQLGEFHRLADEAQYFAANTDSISERVPYYDPRRAKAVGEDALAIAAPWGKKAERLPLSEKRAKFLESQYTLLLLLAQTELLGTTPSGAGAALAILEQAKAIQQPTRGYFQLRSRCLALLGESDAAARETKLADRPATPVTAQDHFLAGELLRLQDAGSAADRIGSDESEANRVPLSDAIQEYRRALQMDARHYWARFQLGRCLLAMGNGPEAVETLSACVALRPDSPWAYTARGLANALSDRPQDALVDLDQAVRLDPSFQPVRLNRGVVHWLQENNDAAIADFSAILTGPEDERLVEAAFYRGQLHLNAQRHREALADFATVIDARPDFRPAYWFHAKTQFQLGAYQDGQADLVNFLEFATPNSLPDNVAALHFETGKALRKMGQELDGKARAEALQRAESELLTAITAGPPTAEMYQQLGAVRELLYLHPQAIESYTKGLSLAADNVPLHNSRGWAFVAGKRHELAQADFAEAIRLAPDDPESHAGLGFVATQIGQRDVARREASAALLTGSNNYLIMHNVACIYGQLSKTEADRKIEHENLALAALTRAADLARQNTSGPNESQLIRQETAFPESLRSRPEFQRLIDDIASNADN